LTLSLPSTAFLAQRLIDAVNEHGGNDNCTVVAVHC
jgi:serine/threonine protein phosphatase PrpC